MCCSEVLLASHVSPENQLDTWRWAEVSPPGRTYSFTSASCSIPKPVSSCKAEAGGGETTAMFSCQLLLDICLPSGLLEAQYLMAPDSQKACTQHARWGEPAIPAHPSRTQQNTRERRTCTDTHSIKGDKKSLYSTLYDKILRKNKNCTVLPYGFSWMISQIFVAVSTCERHKNNLRKFNTCLYIQGICPLPREESAAV